MHKKWRTLLGLLAVLSMLAGACASDEPSANEEAPAPEVEDTDTGAEDPAETAEDTPAEDTPAEDPTDTAGAETDGGENGAVSGSIEIDGSSTVAPLTDAIAEEYANDQPDVNVAIGISGTGGGFERFCGTGDTQISNASRPISEEEVALCEENGFEYTEVRVGTDALTMVTNPETEFLTCLTTEELVTLWGPDGATTWDQVNPEFPSEPIEIFAPDADSGTYDFFNETILEEDVEPRQDYNSSADDNIIAQGIIGTPGSWGYFGFAYFQESGESLQAIEYDAGEGCVAPSVETAQDDSYGLTRPLFIYVRNDALAEPHVADFVTYYLDTVGEVIEDVGYVPATEEAIEEARAGVEETIGSAG